MSEPQNRPQNGPPGPTPPRSMGCNEVVLVGRVSAAPERRELPSGDALVTLRVVVDRPPPREARGGTQNRSQKEGQKSTRRGAAKRSVEVIDVACWSKRTQRTAGGLTADDGVRVEGALRRRFFATDGGRASRYEVEATRLVRVSRSVGPPEG